MDKRMSDGFIVRPAAEHDFPELTELWSRCFGDSREFIHAFFSLLPKFGAGITAERGGKAVGMAYAIIMELSDGGRTRKAGYIYAVAVDESCRSLGAGAALSKAAAEAARELGAEIICTLPAELSLYPWYEKVINTGFTLHRRRETVSAQHSTAPAADCKKISGDEYNTQREKLLAGMPHLCIGGGGAQLLSKLCECNGGALFTLSGGIASAYLENGNCVIRELICPDRLRAQSAAAIAQALHARSAVYFTPDKYGEKYIALDTAIPEDTVWNIAFD